MAFSQVAIVANQIEKQRSGYQAISLTHYDDTLEPQIAAGSEVEIGGALFEATANESITGWAGISNNSDVYIKLTVSGASVTASFVTAVPTWDTAKQGWYSGADRYVFYLRKDGSGNYTRKRLLLPMFMQQSKTLVLEELGLKEFVAASGDNSLFAADVERYTNSTIYAELKTIAIPFSGIIKVAFDLRIVTAGATAYGQIYINGSAVGTERTAGAVYVTFTEDITVNRGDLLQLCVHTSNAGYNVYTRNFRVSVSAQVSDTLLKYLTGPLKN